MEGTSEASLAASAPRAAQMLYQPKNRAQDLAGRRTADCKVGAGTAAATKGLLVRPGSVDLDCQLSLAILGELRLEGLVLRLTT
jgi:hypothetical protein